MKKIVLFLVVVVLTGCGVNQRANNKPPDEKSDLKTVFIKDYKTQCFANFDSAQTLCILMQENSKDDPQLVVGIEGFDYEWGYRYELMIRETEPDANLADAPAVFRDLVQVVSKEKVAPGIRFETTLTTVLPASQVSGDRSRQNITQEASDLFAFFSDPNWYDEGFGREFTCVSDALCEEFSTLIEQELELTIEFAHPGNSDEPLLAQRIVSSKPLPDWY